jgi:hypothetical protein
MAIDPVSVLNLQGIKNFVANLFLRPFDGRTNMKSDNRKTESLAVSITNENTHYTVVKTIYERNKHLHPGITGT